MCFNSASVLVHYGLQVALMECREWIGPFFCYYIVLDDIRPNGGQLKGTVMGGKGYHYCLVVFYMANIGLFVLLKYIPYLNPVSYNFSSFAYIEDLSSVKENDKGCMWW